MLLALLAAAGVGSSLIGQDANWDMQNYHYYNPWAVWNGRVFAWDVAAAQIQTYHNPLPHFPFFAMVSGAWPPRLIAFVLALPTVLAGFFVYRLAWILFVGVPPRERAITVALAVTIGVTSAMGLGALANTMNEWLLTALVTFALWWLVRGQDSDGRIARSALIIAGIALGFAAGAKLTAATFALAMAIALAVRGPRPRLAEPAWLALGAAIGCVVSYGAWGYALWDRFRNPIFPYANQWFQSPWWEPQPIAGRAFGPRSALEFAAFPFRLWEPPLYFTAEVHYRDPRLALLWALAILASVLWLVRRVRRQRVAAMSDAWRLVAWFCGLSFVVWTLAFSIYRYLLPLDALSGLLIGGPLCALLPRRIVPIALLACTIGVIGTTRIADWGRIPFGEQWFETRSLLPRLAPNSLVLVTTGEGVSYLMPRLDPSARYVGAHNTLVEPSQASGLAEEVRKLVREHRGEFYQLTYPLTEGRAVVERHGLARTTTCAVIVTNMPMSPIELCRLVRKVDPR